LDRTQEAVNSSMEAIKDSGQQIRNRRFDISAEMQTLTVDLENLKQSAGRASATVLLLREGDEDPLTGLGKRIHELLDEGRPFRTQLEDLAEQMEDLKTQQAVLNAAKERLDTEVGEFTAALAAIDTLKDMRGDGVNLDAQQVASYLGAKSRQKFFELLWRFGSTVIIDINVDVKYPGIRGLLRLELFNREYANLQLLQSSLDRDEYLKVMHNLEADLRDVVNEGKLKNGGKVIGSIAVAPDGPIIFGGGTTTIPSLDYFEALASALKKQKASLSTARIYLK